MVCLQIWKHHWKYSFSFPQFTTIRFILWSKSHSLLFTHEFLVFWHLYPERNNMNVWVPERGSYEHKTKYWHRGIHPSFIFLNESTMENRRVTSPWDPLLHSSLLEHPPWLGKSILRKKAGDNPPLPKPSATQLDHPSLGVLHQTQCRHWIPAVCWCS
jgi:hypothetical protein